MSEKKREVDRERIRLKRLNQLFENLKLLLIKLYEIFYLADILVAFELKS